MSYRDILHKPFKNAGKVFSAFLDVFTDKFNALVKTAITNINEFSLTTATGDALDKWGLDFNIARFKNETDDKYRERLLSLYRGLGVTKKFLIELGNKVLEKFNVGVSITEWFEQNSGLNKYEFKVNVEEPLTFGYVIGFSGIGIVDASYKGSTIITVKNYYSNYIYPPLKEIIERYRASGTKAIYSVGGYDAE